MSDSPLFPDLPGDAQVWINVASHDLSANVQDAFMERLEAFMDTWTSHQRPVRSAVTIRDDRFLILAATVDDSSVSGCGIDSAVNAIQGIAADLGVQWAPGLSVAYRDGDGDVHTVSRSAFRKKAENGEVHAETIVFDPSVSTLGELRDGQFESRAADAWHSRAFPLAEPA